MKKIILITIMLSIVILASSLVLGQCPDEMVSYWKFDTTMDDDFEGTTLNSKWFYGGILNGVSMTVNDAVYLNKSTYSAGMDAVYIALNGSYLEGDFDVRIDYSNYVAGSSADGGLYLLAYTAGGDDGFYVRRQAALGRYDSSIRINTVWGGSYDYVSTSDTFGTLRLTKSGTTMSAYYWNGFWALINSYTHAEYSAPMYIQVEYNMRDGSGMSTTVDNFKVVTGEPSPDSKGSNVGSIQGATSTTGKLGNALSFDGNDYVNFGSIGGLTSRSVSMWINGNSWQKTGPWENSLYAFNTNSGGNTDIVRISTDGRVGFYDAATMKVQSNTPISTGQWHHFVLVTSGSTSTIYQNGVNVGSTSTWAPSVASSDIFYVGQEQDGASPSDFFNGSIDEVAIYNKSLSASEVKELYEATANKGVGYCSVKPIATSFSGTDINTIPDLTNVSNFEIIKNQGSVKWNNPLNLVGENLDSNINLGMNFVSLNTIGLDSTLDSEANITFMVDGCHNLRIYYVDSGFYDNLNDIKTNGIICPENICSNIDCDGNTLTFTAAHFDGFGGEGDPVGDPVIPEFNLMGIILVIIIASTGLYFISRRS